MSADTSSALAAAHAMVSPLKEGLAPATHIQRIHRLTPPHSHPTPRLDFGVSPNCASKFESHDQDGGAVVPDAVGMVST